MTRVGMTRVGLARVGLARVGLTRVGHRKRWTRLRRWTAAVVLVAVPSLVLAVPATAEPPPGEGIDKPTASAMTKTGRKAKYDDFSKLEVTVSQTKGLTSQAISVRWKGGKPTPAGTVGANFLQLMQCWGDPEAADFRETCQFGAGIGAFGTVGAYVNLRGLQQAQWDPAEKVYPNDAQTVPFKSVGGTVTPHGGKDKPFPLKDPNNPHSAKTPDEILSEYFSPYSTNEVPFGITYGDGTGRVVFEVQTAVEAPHLGCGTAQPSAGGKTVGRPCSLVVVPRGEYDIDGTLADGSGNQVDGSPLSATWWEDRIVFPLEFEPIGGFCPLGVRERLTTGSELVSAAVTSWQPALCAGGGPVIGYTQNGDGEAGRQVTTTTPGAPGLAFTSDPVTPPEGGAAVLHAPVALSGAVIAFNIDIRTELGSPEQQALRGLPVRELKLTPLLVAKLLTYSYQRDVPGGQQGEAPHVKDNLRNIRNDPEFLELNPIFAIFHQASGPDGLLVAGGKSAAAREVWRWILADPTARAWMAGEHDASKMVVNKHYRGLGIDGPVPEDYPRNDHSCYKAEPATIPFCVLDMRPGVSSMGQGSYQTLRADSKSKIAWDLAKSPPGYAVSKPQIPGVRWQMTITDAASAARYGLFTASLRNRAGQFVAPNTESMLAGAGAMIASPVAGVLAIDPQRAAPGAYPLSMLTYAAADTSEEAAARRDYATLLRHAAGPGQTPGNDRGQLPAGYAPLPEAMRAQALATADRLETWVAPATATGEQTTSGSGAGATVGVPNPGSSIAASGRASARASTKPIAKTQTTPGEHVGTIRFALLVLVVVGTVGAVAGPTLSRITTRRRARGIPAEADDEDLGL